MEKRYWLRAAGWVAAALMVVSGCSDQEPSDEVNQTRLVIDEDVRSALAWGEFAGHPMQTALEDCVFLTQKQLLLIHRVWNDRAMGDEDLMALGEAFGLEGTGEGDEFARNRALESARKRMLEEINTFGDRPFCVELALHVDSYDFDREMLTLADRGTSKFYRDVLSQRDYVTVDRVVPADYAPPLELRLSGIDNALTMPLSQAEVLLGSLEWAESSEEKASGGGAQDEYFTLSPTELLPEAAFRAFSLEEMTGIVVYREATRELLQGVEQLLVPSEGARLAPAVAVFRLGSKSGDFNIHVVGGDQVRLGVVHGVAEQLLIFDEATREVQAVWPSANPSHQGAEVEPQKADPEQHRALMETACEGPIKEFREMQIVDEELREVVSYGCERCPGTLRGRRGPMLIDFVAQGSFSGPGAEEALVHSQGCYARNPTRGGVMTYLRRKLSGEWKVVLHDSVVWSECAFFPTSHGTSLPLCDEIPMGEDNFVRRYRTLQPAESDFVVTQLFKAGSDMVSCDSSFARVSMEDVSVVQNAQNEDELRFVVDLLTGRTEDGSPHCYEDSSIREETTRLEFGLKVKRRDVVPTAEAQRALDRLEGLL